MDDQYRYCNMKADVSGDDGFQVYIWHNGNLHDDDFMVKVVANGSTRSFKFDGGVLPSFDDCKEG